MLTCRDFAAGLREFLDGDLEPSRRRLFLKHLAGCRDCATYLETYRATIRLSRMAHSEPETRLPGELFRSILAARRAPNAHFWHLIGAVAASPLLFFYFGSIGVL